MFKTLLMTLKIDNTYSLNAFIYNIRRLPILKDLITDDIYKSRNLKTIINIISNIYQIIKILTLHLLYFLFIYLIAVILNENNFTKTFIHIYFIFTIIGFFINNKLLNTSSKKYFSIILFKMDAKKFMESYLFFDIFKYLILNIISFTILN